MNFFGKVCKGLQRLAKACKGLQRLAKTYCLLYLPISLFEILKSKAIQKHRFWEIPIYITSIQCKQLFKNFLETWKFWFTRLKQRKEMQIISYYRKKSYFDLPFNRESMMLNFPHSHSSIVNRWKFFF